MGQRGRMRVAGYFLWGLLLFSASALGLWLLLDVLFDKYEGVVRAFMAVEYWLEAMGLSSQLSISFVLGLVRALFWATGFAWSALSVLRAGPREGRLPRGPVLLLSVGLAFLATLGFAFQDCLPEGVRKGAFFASVFILPVAWCLTWAWDVVRRQVSLPHTAASPPCSGAGHRP